MGGRQGPSWYMCHEYLHLVISSQLGQILKEGLDKMYEVNLFHILPILFDIDNGKGCKL
ncbi:hypothetical protein PILCRDRAFT_820518 [Piloderma croceum F 1598]|uniref:Uncharacterized protein n=1 Tax=Piloderma croceum (strain F 1598) TaxID=765440 RepID=A0A0C3FC08_PILCF|nr:hypothetical protein PILCRDRAFT_820518 [Piloderma croceum F 1598]